MLAPLLKYCPACKWSFRLPDNKNLFDCPHCGKELLIHHKHLATVIVFCYALGFLLAFPEYGNAPAFIFAGLSCAFLCLLLAFGVVLPYLPRELFQPRSRSHPREWLMKWNAGHR